MSDRRAFLATAGIGLAGRLARPRLFLGMLSSDVLIRPKALRGGEVSAVFAIRGGYGSMHLLDRIDYDLIHRNPKIFLGYSDITAMHLAINKHAQLVTFHGPIALSRFTDFTQNYFRKALFDIHPSER